MTWKFGIKEMAFSSSCADQTYASSLLLCPSVILNCEDLWVYVVGLQYVALSSVLYRFINNLGLYFERCSLQNTCTFSIDGQVHGMEIC